MSAVDEIISYKRSPNEEFYALLNCDEHSSVSICIVSLFNLSLASISIFFLVSFLFGLRWGWVSECDSGCATKLWTFQLLRIINIHLKVTKIEMKNCCTWHSVCLSQSMTEHSLATCSHRSKILIFDVEHRVSVCVSGNGMILVPFRIKSLLCDH